MAMSTPDMEVIKEIPGYKVILKAVLKSQIQQLVEQLAKTTDEESVILTASVADGTLCHLGSDSGKIFLEDHEDIKSQFLGFCLKRHHAEKLEQERKTAQEREDALSRSMQSEPSPHFISIPPFNLTQYQPPRRNSPRIRSPSNRHQPYPIRGPIPVGQHIKSNTVHAPVSSTRTSTEGPVIKTEPFSDNENSNSQAGGVSNSNISSEPASTFNSTISSPDSKRENCLSSAVDPSVLDNSINIGLDPNVSVKLESGTNDEELEITGVELGQGPPVSKQDWTLNLQAGGPGATGTSAEMNPDQQGFNSSSNSSTRKSIAKSTNGKKSFICAICGREFQTNSGLRKHEMRHKGTGKYNCEICGVMSFSLNDYKTHLTTHTDKRPYACSKCDKTFKTENSLKYHDRRHDDNHVIRYQCDVCGARYNKTRDLAEHQRKHSQEKPERCPQCGKCFRFKNNLRRHLKIHAKK